MSARADTVPRHELERRGFAISGVAAIGVVGVLAAGVVARSPMSVVVLLAGAAVVLAIVPHLTVATAALAGGFFYDDYFTESFGFWNPGKMLGVVAVASLALSLVKDRRPLVWTSQVGTIALMVGALAMSYTFARDPGVAAQVGIRYAMFFTLFCIVLQAVRSRKDVEDILDIMIVAGTLAAVIGVAAFSFGHVDRVSGPLADPGDFGFQLASIVPLILYRITTTRGVHRAVLGVSCVVVSAAILGSFSRASLLGLAAAGAWAMATGRLRIRWGVAVLVAMMLVGLAAYQLEPEVIESTFDQKQFVAQANVNSRFGLWEVAVMEWESAPLFGVGPGNFEVRFPEFRSPLHQRIETTHNAYLNVLAELGLVGLVLFTTFLAQSWRELRRRVVGPREDISVRTALAGAFIVALVGAFFMTQQFYPPLWFLAALGTALNKVPSQDAA